ncbi:MAG TPA: hypothetical protein VHR45_04900 [Thermoanaerobaculia bacterium]|nr:hypothetical protein [Thermoanaerobaculia bacterium]
MNNMLMFAALRPNRNLNDRESLDWAPHLLTGSSRREVLCAHEYHGADLPLGTPELEFDQHRRQTTRMVRG